METRKVKNLVKIKDVIDEINNLTLEDVENAVKESKYKEHSFMLGTNIENYFSLICNDTYSCQFCIFRINNHSIPCDAVESVQLTKYAPSSLELFLAYKKLAIELTNLIDLYERGTNQS